MLALLLITVLAWPSLAKEAELCNASFIQLNLGLQTAEPSLGNAEDQTSCNVSLGLLEQALRSRDAKSFQGLASFVQVQCSEEDAVRILEPEVNRNRLEAVEFLERARQELPTSKGQEMQEEERNDSGTTPGGAQSLFFIHIPKNAGSTIETVGNTVGLKWGRFYFNEANFTGTGIRSDGSVRYMPDRNFCSNHHIPPLLAFSRGQSPYQGQNNFCVARDPYDRLVSDYRYMAEWAGNWRHPFYWWFKLYRNGMDKRLLCTKEGLNKFVKTSSRLYNSGETYINDCHMVPQHEYIWRRDGERWCQSILPFENLTAEFNAFMERNDCAARITDDGSTNVASNCPDLTADDLSDSAVQDLNAIFDEDFRRLGFRKRTR